MKKSVVILFVFLLIFNLCLVNAIDDVFYKKLISKGLTIDQANTIAKKYATENDFLEAVRQAVDKKETEMLGIPIELIKKDFYKPGIISTSFSNWWNGPSGITDAISSFFGGLFGDTPTGIFKTIIGIKKNLSERIVDLIVAFLTSLLVAGLYKLSHHSLFKENEYRKEWTEKEREDKKTRLNHLILLVGRPIKHKIENEYNTEISWIKVLLIFPGIYFALFQIPIINRIIEFITFYHFMPGSPNLTSFIDIFASWLPNIIIRTLFSFLIIAFFADILPALLEMRRNQKEAKKKLEEKVGKAIIKELGKVDEGTLHKLTKHYTE